MANQLISSMQPYSVYAAPCSNNCSALGGNSWYLAAPVSYTTAGSSIIWDVYSPVPVNSLTAFSGGTTVALPAGDDAYWQSSTPYTFAGLNWQIISSRAKSNVVSCQASGTYGGFAIDGFVTYAIPNISSYTVTNLPWGNWRIFLTLPYDSGSQICDTVLGTGTYPDPTTYTSLGAGQGYVGDALWYAPPSGWTAPPDVTSLTTEMVATAEPSGASIAVNWNYGQYQPGVSLLNGSDLLSIGYAQTGGGCGQDFTINYAYGWYYPSNPFTYYGPPCGYSSGGMSCYPTAPGAVQYNFPQAGEAAAYWCDIAVPTGQSATLVFSATSAMPDFCISAILMSRCQSGCVFMQPLDNLGD